MALPSYEIYITDLANPSFHFVNNEIKEPSSIQGVDLIGDTLSVDTFSINVFYSGQQMDALRTLPFGTPVWYFKNGTLVYKIYINKITRVSKMEFQLECVSAIGLLDKSSHIGGVYTGETVGEILESIIGDIVEYSVDEDVSATKVFGYLPYKSRRENLHQLMFAHNISILRDGDGDMRFTYLRSEDEPIEISSDRIYIDGKVEYPPIATEVIIVEHSYQFDDSVEEVTLYDNTSSSPANHKRVIFDTAPIYVPSLKTTDDMVIEVAHPNFVVVSGTGTVIGVPYYDNMSAVTRTNETDGEEYTIDIKDATLINVLNSEYVADRIMSYYSSAKIVSGSIKMDGEAVGHRYTFLDAFEETVVAFLKKITTYASSFVKATSEFVTGYRSEWFGNNYTHYLEVMEPCDVIVPEGCSKLRFIIIGGGEGGTRGTTASAPPGMDVQSGQLVIDPSAGEPGEAGDPGLGGSIREVIIEEPEAGLYHCSIGMHGNGESVWKDRFGAKYVSQSASESSVTCPDNTVYSSGDDQAYKCNSGVMNLFTSHVYGKYGKEGIDGGRAGRGAFPTGEDGEGVWYDGVYYAPGLGATGFTFDFAHANTSVQVGGGGGDGAMAYINGASSIPPSRTAYSDQTSSRNAADWEEVTFSQSLTKTTRGIVPEILTDRGCGGNAGCGAAACAGEGPGGFLDEDYNNAAGKLVHRKATTFGYPSEIHNGWHGDRFITRFGTSGRDGGRGIIIIYANRPLEIENESKIPSPELTPVSGAASTQIEILAENLVENQTYIIQRKMFSSNATSSDSGLIGPGGGEDYINQLILHFYGEWEPRGSFTTATGETSHTIYEQSSSADAFAAIPKSSYLYRIRAVGDEENGESEWSNEVVVGFGLNNLTVNPIVDVFPVNGGNYRKSALFVFSGLDKPNRYSNVKENYQRQLDGELQWYDAVSSPSSSYGMLDNAVSVGNTYNYREYLSHSDGTWLCSQMSNTKSGTVQEVTNKLFSPYFASLDIVTDPSISTGTRLNFGWFRADYRTEQLHVAWRYADRAWWQVKTTFDVSTYTEYTLWYLQNQNIPLHKSEYSSVNTMEFTLFGVANDYEMSKNGNIQEYIYPDNRLFTPSSLSASVSNGNVYIMWGVVYHVDHFRIMRYDLGTSTWALLSDSITATSYIDTTATSGSNYYYRLDCIAETGYETPTAVQIQVTVEDGAISKILDPPVVVGTYTYRIAPSGFVGYITLEWDNDPYNNNRAVIERRIGNNRWELLGNAVYRYDEPVYVDEDTEFGVEYSYRISFPGVNGDLIHTYESPPSNIITMMAMNGEPTTLTAPEITLSIADRFAGTVEIAWAAIPDALSYLLQRKLHSDVIAPWIDIPISYASLTYTDTDTEIDNTYDYRMKAVGNGASILDSEFSEISTIIIPDPYASLIQLEAVELTLSQRTDLNTVDASWSANPNAYSYRLERKLASASSWTTVYNGSALAFTDSGLTWEAVYDYRITVIGDLITYKNSTPTSDSIEIELPTIVQLAAPVLQGQFTIAGGHGVILLGWASISNASGYKLERKLSTDSSYTVIESSISSSEQSYVDSTVTGGNTYLYKLTALGDGLFYSDSDPSNELQIATSWVRTKALYIDGIGQGNAGMSTYEDFVALTEYNYEALYNANFTVNPYNGAVRVYTSPGVYNGRAYRGGFRLENKEDLTNYSVLSITIKNPLDNESSTSSSQQGFGSTHAFVRPNVSESGGFEERLSLTRYYQTFNIDISGLTGSYYIGLQMFTFPPYGRNEIWIKDMYLYG